MRKQIKASINKEINHIVNDLKKYREVKAVIWFGSSLNGKFKPISDIDIAVVLENASKKVEAEIFSRYSNKVDLVNFLRLPRYIQFEVLKTGRIIHVKDKDYLSELARKVIRQYLEMSYFYEIRSKRLLT